MTTNRDTPPMTSRELGALGIATAAVTLAIGITLAVLAGHARISEPSASVATEPSVATASVEPDPASSSRVVLVPVERAPAPRARDAISSEASAESVPSTERDEDDREEIDDERHERHERGERHEPRRHESLWGDDDEEGLDG